MWPSCRASSPPILSSTAMSRLTTRIGNPGFRNPALIPVDPSLPEGEKSTFSNIPQRAKTPLARRIETAQTFLTAAEIDDLVGDYLGGASIDGHAQRYGIHRATVFAHLRRRNTPRRRLGLDVDEGAEAVRLFRGGVSMRAISRSLGWGGRLCVRAWWKRE